MSFFLLKSFGRMPFQTTAKYLTLFVLNLAIYENAHSQSLPDSIVIIKCTYANMGWIDGAYRDSLYRTKRILFKKGTGIYASKENTVDDNIILDLIKELNDPQSLKNTLYKYDIDTTWIKNNPEKMFELLSEAKRFRWNKQQKDLILKELVNIKHYEKKLANYINDGCCYSMHENNRNQYFVEIYSKNRLINYVTSRKYVWGYRYPWTDSRNNKLYSFKIENIIDTLLLSQRKTKPPLVGKQLLKLLANYVLAINSDTLYKLAPYTYQKEIDELKTAFKIVSFNQMAGYGGYHGNDPTIEIRLKTAEMLPNVSIQFLATIKSNTIYSRDSVIKDYKKLVDRVQSIKFLADYLNTNFKVNLDILYFNNHTINQYNIDGVNKNPEEWKKHDSDIKNFDWYKENNMTPSFSISEAIKTSEHLYCGCNYRFPKEFIEKAVCFIIDDNEKNHSMWLLLPDNTVLLYLMQGKKVLNYRYTDFGKYPGMQYPCVRFGNTGKIISKKNID